MDPLTKEQAAQMLENGYSTAAAKEEARVMSEDAAKVLADFVRETGCDLAATLDTTAGDDFKQERHDLTLDWQGLALSIEFKPDWLGNEGLCHIAVISPAKKPLPITETGYRSLFVSTVILDEWGGPLPYVQGMLDIEAERPAWKEAQAKRQQLTLF